MSNTKTKRAIESELRKLSKHLIRLEDEAETTENKMLLLLQEHCGLRKGDEVVYVGPDPKRFMSGIVKEVRFARGWKQHGYLKYPYPIVVVHTFKKSQPRALSHRHDSIRIYMIASDLKLVKPAAQVAPYSR